MKIADQDDDCEVTSFNLLQSDIGYTLGPPVQQTQQDGELRCVSQFVSNAMLFSFSLVHFESVLLESVLLDNLITSGPTTRGL
eukprot:scaffold39793_cov49-Attheya_sp.AAC.1